MRIAKAAAGTGGVLARLEGWIQGVGLDVLRGTYRISQTAESLSLGFAPDRGGAFSMGRTELMNHIGRLIDWWNRTYNYLKATTGQDPLEWDVYSVMMALDVEDPYYVPGYTLRKITGYSSCYSYLMK